jgi:hypothetical protein
MRCKAMLYYNYCHTPLIFKKKIDPKTKLLIEREFNTKAENVIVYRGIVAWGHTGKEV